MKQSYLIAAGCNSNRQNYRVRKASRSARLTQTYHGCWLTGRYLGSRARISPEKSASLLRLVSVTAGAFLGTDATDEPITSGLPVIRGQSAEAPPTGSHPG
jgi:hypothetical protein